MTRGDIIRLAREAGFETRRDMVWVDQVELTSSMERFAALVAAAEREKVAQWMIQRNYATGHGDTIEDLLNELEWQIRESEREACARVCDEYAKNSSNPMNFAENCAAAIRARGET